jgi:hypothetical protein
MRMFIHSTFLDIAPSFFLLSYFKPSFLSRPQGMWQSLHRFIYWYSVRPAHFSGAEQEDWAQRQGIVLQEFSEIAKEVEFSLYLHPSPRGSLYLCLTPQTCPSVCLRVHLVTGDPRDGLTSVAEREGAECIVVGSRGQGVVARALLGNVL